MRLARTVGACQDVDAGRRPQAQSIEARKALQPDPGGYRMFAAAGDAGESIPFPCRLRPRNVGRRCGSGCAGAEVDPDNWTVR